MSAILKEPPIWAPPDQRTTSTMVSLSSRAIFFSAVHSSWVIGIEYLFALGIKGLTQYKSFFGEVKKIRKGKSPAVN
jgi:hypothetical protein